MKTVRELYKACIDKWGHETQLEILLEECSELIFTLQKRKRGKRSTLELCEEIADVEIMIEQARVMFGDSTINDLKRKKLVRLEKLLEK